MSSGSCRVDAPPPPELQYDARMRIHRRLVNLAGFLACVLMLGYALYAQFHDNLEPCPLCIFQRIGLAAIGIVFLAAALYGARAWGRIVYAALFFLTAATEAGIAARHIYVQHAPPGSIPACGAPLEMMMSMFPVSEVIRKVLSGGGECAVVNWTFFGLSMPVWVLIAALLLGAIGIANNLRRPPAATIASPDPAVLKTPQTGA